MKLNFFVGLCLSYFLAATALTVPPGYNPNLSIEEQRRQEEFLRLQREKIQKEKAKQHFDEDAHIEVIARMRDAQTGKKIDGSVSYTIISSGKTYNFVQGEKDTYIARIRKFSDIRLVFLSPQHFAITEMIPLNTLMPLESLEVSTQLLRKSEADGSATIDIIFDPDSSRLRPAYFDILQLVAKTLRSNPALSVIIKGYAGREAVNDEAARRISQGRAFVIRDFLLNARVPKNQVQAVAMGVDDSQKEAAREYRAELFLMDLSD